MKDFDIDSISDAFLALNEIDDDDVSGMIRRNGKLHEGKNFSLFDISTNGDEALEMINHPDDEVELEVIDADADAVEHIRKKEDYLGQAILCCNRCRSNRFVETDSLVPDADDPELYNVEDECPNCHQSASGYELIGQVGKVLPDAEESAEEEPEEAEEIPVEEEPAEEAAEESDASEEIDFVEPEEPDGMETDVSEDDEFPEVLPELGDEVDTDPLNTSEEEEDEEEDKEESFNRFLGDHLALTEAENHYANDAWMMNKVISSMNDEDAYFGRWLYYWPDGETKEACEYDFGDVDSYEELEEVFKDVYQRYHSGGLYDAEPDVEKFAHSWDSKLNLSKIENIPPVKMHEDFQQRKIGTVRELLDFMLDSDIIERVIVHDAIKNNDVVYDGTLEDLPQRVLNTDVINFGSGDRYLSIGFSNVVGPDDISPRLYEIAPIIVPNQLLDLWDSEDNDHFTSMTASAISDMTKGVNQFRVDCVIAPKTLILYVADVKLESLEKEESLAEAIIKENSLNVYNSRNPRTTEYWINEAIETNEDLDIIYENFVKGTSLEKRFKRETGYRTMLEQLLMAEGHQVIVDDETEEQKSEVETPSKVTSVATRKELAEEIQRLKNNNRPFSIRRSMTAGYRYDIVEELGDEDEEDAAIEDQEIADTTPDAEISSDAIADMNEAAAESDNEILSKLLIDEKEAIEGYQEAIDKVSETSFKDVLKHINEEELEHIEELSELVAGHSDDASEEQLPEDLNEENEIVPAHENNIEPYTEEQMEFMRRVTDVARNISDAIQRYYNIEADPALVVADILQDLRLIRGDINPDDLEDTPMNNLTRAMFNDYNAAYEFIDDILSMFTGEEIHTISEQKLMQAISALNSPAFDREAIDAGIRSTRFLAAARSGQIPYIPANSVPMLEELDEPNVSQFDLEMSNFFDECYGEDSYKTYVTESYEVNEDGSMLFKGTIFDDDDSEEQVEFKLTPDEKLTEAAGNGKKTYRVTSNVSNEEFEFQF